MSLMRCGCQLRTSHVTATDTQREAMVREAKKARDRMRALDRSWRASNTSQYGLSKKQQARAERRHACSCGVEGDRDLVSAAMASTVVLTDPVDPRTTTIDHGLRERLHAAGDNVGDW